MLPAKICGITRLEDAQLACDRGAQAIGFIFYPQSPRYIDPQTAAMMASRLPKRLKKVGVFVNEKAVNINEIIEQVPLDYAQLHGEESPAACADLTIPVIKSFRVGPDFDPETVAQYHVHACLFDTMHSGARGGTGRQFPWEKLEGISRDRPLILAGGLRSENIAQAIQETNPDAIDVSSGVEKQPGIKSTVKLTRLLRLIKSHPARKKVF